jgi:copper resistance protein C
MRSFRKPLRSPGSVRVHPALALGVATLAFAAVAAPLSTPADASDHGWTHLRLAATSPAADTVVTEPPAEVRLWFSEPPQMRGTSLRLADGGGELVPTTDAVADEEDPSQVFIRPLDTLGPGEYTVHWRVIAQDGHAQNGNFGFELGSP